MLARMRLAKRQPQQRPADEELRRHQVRMHPVVEHDEVKADQSHVVGQRHPGEADVIRREAGRLRSTPRALAMMLPCVSTTPLGSLVEPEENWMKATSSGCACVRLAGAARCRPGHRPGTRATRSASKVCASPTCAGEGADALERAALGVDEGLAELARDAQQLVAVLIADAERHRHGDDAAEHRGPERIDELLVVAEEEDQLVAAARTEALQVMQDAERARVQLVIAHVAGVVLALQVGDLAGRPRLASMQLGQSRAFDGRVVRHQRRSSLMCRG